MKALRALSLAPCVFVVGFLLGALVTWGDMRGALKFGLAFTACMAVIFLAVEGGAWLWRLPLKERTKYAVLIPASGSVSGLAMAALRRVRTHGT